MNTIGGRRVNDIVCYRCNKQQSDRYYLILVDQLERAWSAVHIRKNTDGLAVLILFRDMTGICPQCKTISTGMFCQIAQRNAFRFVSPQEDLKNGIALHLTDQEWGRVEHLDENNCTIVLATP